MSRDQKFRAAWKQDPKLKDWILEVPSEPTKAKCRFCPRKTYSARYSALMDHAGSKIHQKNIADISEVAERIRSNEGPFEMESSSIPSIDIEIMVSDEDEEKEDTKATNLEDQTGIGMTNGVTEKSYVEPSQKIPTTPGRKRSRGKTSKPHETKAAVVQQISADLEDTMEKIRLCEEELSKLMVRKLRLEFEYKYYNNN